MEALSEITLNQMANYPDFLPTATCYLELLSAACRKFDCKLDEAREKYGRLTNAEWYELLSNN